MGEIIKTLCAMFGPSFQYPSSSLRDLPPKYSTINHNMTNPNEQPKPTGFSTDQLVLELLDRAICKQRRALRQHDQALTFMQARLDRQLAERERQVKRMVEPTACLF